MSATSHLVELAVDEMRAALAPAVGRDWDVPAGSLEWTCRETVAHVADDLFSYASQVIAQPADAYLPIEVVLDPHATNHESLLAVAMCGRLLSNAVDSASPQSRGWHPSGTSDPDGFAAMGVVEVLVHTHDITTGLGLDWRPSSRLSAPALRRLFPAAPAGDASAVLLHVTGRRALAGHELPTSWAWDSSVRSEPTSPA